MSGDLSEVISLEDKLKSIEDAKEFLLSKTSKRPEIAIVCGTGLGGLADVLEDPEIFPYEDIPHFPKSTVPGHIGRLVFGKLGDKEVVCMQGRVHAYEGHDFWTATLGIRVFSAIGVKVLILTNASGGVNRELNEGDVVILNDHVNIPGMAGFNPLVGLNDARFGPRFQETTTAYDLSLQEIAFSSAKELEMDYVKGGIYCYQFGPAYESPAEIRCLLNMGIDVVGMSTVPEVLVARHCGVKCLGISLVTNVCVADHCTGKKPNHEEVLELGAKRAHDLQRLVSKIVASIE